ncbi:MAG: universal stress protein [Flavitalea sp.]
MKKILVPTDFSETSKNAARYAVQLASKVTGVKVIFYHVYNGMAAGSDGSLLTETREDRTRVLDFAFANFETEMALEGVPVQSVYENGDSLVSAVEKYVRNNSIDLVIMGITGASEIDQALMGSNAVDMAREGICPVIIVPPSATYKPIENVLLATDFKDVQSTVPVNIIIKVLDLFKPILHIVHTGDGESIDSKTGFKTEKAWLETSFESYDPDFYFIHSEDFLEAISNFTADHSIDMIVTVPKNHSFLNNFFKKNHTKKLAYHSHIPVLAIHE